MRKDEILARLRDAIQLSAPDWDFAPGSPDYKILEAVAGEIEAVTFDSVLNDYHFDIDKKSGLELEQFVAMFGFQRLAGKRAIGSVTFGRGTPADHDYIIQIGTQVYVPSDAVNPSLFFSTIGVGVVSQGATSVEVPVQAAVIGAVGNVTAGKITTIQASVDGVSSVVNQDPMTGGRDPESDDDLRSRWKRTVFRSLAGTEDQFLALALNDEVVTRAIVIGPVERFREQLQVAAGAVTSEVPDSKFTYPSVGGTGGEFIGFGIDGFNEIMGARDVDYSMSSAVPPVFTILNADLFPDGSVVDVEHEYTPKASRNNPATNVLDKVDLFLVGDDPVDVIEELPFDRSAVFTTGDPTDALDNSHWLRSDGTEPVAGSFFLQLFKTPISSLPPTISVSGVIYYLNQDYFLVREIEVNKNSTRARDGIEWVAGNAKQKITVSGATPGGPGTFTLTFKGETTAPIAGDATAADVKAALEALAAIGAGDIGATGGPLNTLPVTITFQGGMANLGEPLLSPNGAALIPNPGSLITVQSLLGGVIEDATQLDVEYFYNSVVERVGAQIELVRLIGMDTLVHRARYRLLRFNLAVVLTFSSSLAAVQSDLETAITNWLNQKPFQDNVQVADILHVAESVSGVDNVRLLKSAEAQDEEWQLVIGGTGPGSFALQVNGEITGAISFASVTSGTALNNQNAIKNALEALQTVVAGDVTVTQTSGAPFTFTIVFTGVNMGNREVPLSTTAVTGMTADLVELVQGTGHGIHSLSENGRAILDTFDADFYLDSDEIPVLFDVAVRARARNTF